MKKIFLCFLCLIILSTIPCSVFAEDIQTGNESTAIETGAESAISASTEHFTSTEQNEEGADKLLSVKFKEWVVPHLEEISVIITLIGTLFYQIRKNKALGKTLGTMNNNAVSIAQNSSDMMSQALLNMQNASGAVTAYDARIAAMLEAYRLMAEDRARLEQEILEMKTYLKTAAESNLEFSNELAELLKNLDRRDWRTSSCRREIHQRGRVRSAECRSSGLRGGGGSCRRRNVNFGIGTSRYLAFWWRVGFQFTP